MTVERVPYTELPPAAIGDARVLLADYTVGLAASELGIPPPRIRWFARIPTPDPWPLDGWFDDRHLAGMTRYHVAGEIWLAAGLNRGELVETVAHEAHHARWLERTGTGGRGEHEIEVMERAAIWFAQEFVDRHFRRYRE